MAGVAARSNSPYDIKCNSTAGRTHYRIQIDWKCLGPRRAVAMRAAFDLQGDDTDDVVPTWLTDANAKVVKASPCINNLTPDLGCWYCKPTPKPADPQTDSGARDGAVVESAGTRGGGDETVPGSSSEESSQSQKSHGQ